MKQAAGEDEESGHGDHAVGNVDGDRVEEVGVVESVDGVQPTTL